MPPEPAAASFRDTVDAFAAALIDPSRAAPAQTLGPEGKPDARRFAVYRNNVAVSLIASLAARYPVTRRLVGEDFFRAMARAYAAAVKPDSPVLIHYGRGFPAFIARFEPARDLPYLGDVACLENAWVEAYHAAEASPLNVAALAALDAESLAAATVIFHPAARLLSSDHPIASIWAAHQIANETPRVENWRAEAALVTRPEADVLVRVLPPGGYAFASALYGGASLSDAHAATDTEDFDVGAHLVGLIEAGALVELKSGEG
ncbi:MAG TPA: DNA-binding domain-containing protein [Roseiarcus sp.]|nr:DNA-binding domain-containing protein [Roseiarcus sp.]